MAAKSPVHFVTNDDVTVCGTRLWGRSNGRAPICSTNPDHIPCESCKAEAEYAAADEARSAAADRDAWAAQDA